MKNPKKISIFDYVDYRHFLHDYYIHRKSQLRSFSYRSFAAQAGLSPSLLKDILNHRQNLTVASMQKYAGAMELTDRERDYFAALVGFTNGRTNADKNHSFNQMCRLRGRTPLAFLDEQKYAYFSQWYHAVVREMVTHMGLGNNPAAIARMIVPRISEAQVKKSIALLTRLALIRQDDAGTWHAVDTVISSEYQVQSVALKNYHTQMTQRAQEALEHFDSDKREFQALTLCASPATLSRLKHRIRSFSDELLREVAAEHEPPGIVFQCNLQLFPLIDPDGAS